MPFKAKKSSEAERLDALQEYQILDSLSEAAFDELASLAASICEAPISLITLVDENRQWFKSEFGLDLKETKRTISFCSHAIEQPELFIVPDATKDPRFAHNPLVTADPHIRFYAGAPLVTPRGDALGTLCVIDRQPRHMKHEHQQALRVLSRHVMTLLDNRRRKRALQQSREQLARESQARAKAEGRFELLAETVPHLVWECHPDGSLEYLNQRCLDFLRPTAEEMKAGGWTHSLHPEDREACLDRWTRSLQSGELFECEARLKRAEDGAWRWHLAQAMPQRGPDGRILRWCGTFTDLHGRKTNENALQATAHELESQLRQAQKLESIGQLAAGIAHDFNNLLTVQEGYLSMLLEEPSLPPRQLDLLRPVATACEQAASLTRQLLLFSRKQAFQPALLNLNQIVETIAKMLQRILGEDIELSLKLSQDPPFVQADPGMMEQILMNLAINARDAMPAGGSLTIETERTRLDESAAAKRPNAQPGAFCRLAVSDTGVGIAPEAQEHLFEPFYTTKPAGKGTGLGLATVHGIVAQHHGWIELQSAVEAGSTFSVYLPAAAQTSPGDAAPEATAATPRGSETLILVEDESEVREMASLFLESCGYTVLAAKDGPDALQRWQARREGIALLVTDLVMPGEITGLELARRLRQDQPSLPVILTSGYFSHSAHNPPGLDGRYRHLQKPYGLQLLAQTARELLDAPAP